MRIQQQLLLLFSIALVFAVTVKNLVTKVLDPGLNLSHLIGRACLRNCFIRLKQAKQVVLSNELVLELE